MKLPTNIRNKDGNLVFQKDYPLRIRDSGVGKTFSRALGLKAAKATDIEIARAKQEALDSFNRRVKLIESSGMHQFTEEEIEAEVAARLKSLKLQRGEYANYQVDPLIRLNEESQQRQLQPDGQDLAELDSGVDDVWHKMRTKQTLTSQDLITLRLYEALLDESATARVTMMSLWDEYVSFRGIVLSTSEGKKAQKRWDRWMEIVGNCFVNEESQKVIRRSLQIYADKRALTAVSSSTIERELSDIMSALKHASKRYGFGWYIERPVIKQTPKNVRDALEPSEQSALINYCLKNPPVNHRLLCCCILIEIQGGAMVSEISRLLPEDIRLNHPVPHLVIKNRTKKEARKRVIPVVLGLNFIRHHLNDTIEWLNKVTGATHSARIKQLMRNVTGNKNLSAHWLRHSFRANAQLAGADILTIASIAGWSDAQKHVSQDLIKYSAEAITQSALLKRLFEENLRIQAKLIDVENKLLAASNVVSIRTNRSEGT